MSTKTIIRIKINKLVLPNYNDTLEHNHFYLILLKIGLNTNI